MFNNIAPTQRQLQIALDGCSVGSAIRHRRRGRFAARQQWTADWRCHISLIIAAGC